jgi:hypothetical protein
MDNIMLFGEAFLVLVGIAVFLNATLIVFFVYCWVENHLPSLEISLSARSALADQEELGSLARGDN